MSNQEHLSNKYFKHLLNKKWLVIVLCFIFASLFGVGLKNLEFTNDYRVFFGKTNPELIAFEELEESYSRSDGLLFVLVPKDKNIFNNKNLQAIKEFTRRAWKVPYSIRVESITNYQHTVAQNDELIVANLVPEDKVTLNNEEVAKVRAVALSEPSLHNLLITDRADVSGVGVSVHLPGQSPDEVLEVSQAARKIRDQFLVEYPDFEVKTSGIIALNNAFAEAGLSDATVLTPIMYLIMLIIMAIILRSFLATITALAVIIFSIVSTMGLSGLLGVQLTAPSAIAPTVILTLAIADSVHILITFFNLLNEGLHKVEALLEALKVNIMPVFLTSITTAVGFLCLNFSDSPPFHDLGNMTALGVGFAFIYSIVLLPCLVLVLPIKRGKVASKNTIFFQSLAHFVVRNSNKLIVAVSLLFFLLLFYVPKIQFNDQFVDWFGEKLEFRQDAEYVLKNLTGIYNLQYSLPSHQEEGIHDPEYQKILSDFTDWWREQPEVQHVSSYTDVIKRLSKSMHNDDPSWYKLPNDTELAAQYMLLYEMSLPFGLDLNNQVDIAKSSSKLNITIKKINTTEIRELAVRGDQWLAEKSPKHAVKASGPTLMFSFISQRNIMSMIKGTLLAFILITLLMMISLKSFKYGMISIVPNVMPAIMSFGLWVLLFEEAGMAISIVASATLGIIVDDSVHFLAKFLRAKRKKGYSTEKAIEYAFSNVGLALVVTSIVLICGFVVLSFSNFLLNWSLGFLAAVTIVFALLVDFFLLPPLLLKLDSSRKKEKL